MNRPYALKRLLEHGELTFAEIHEITGWKYRQVASALDQLKECELVQAMRYGTRISWQLVYKTDKHDAWLLTIKNLQRKTGFEIPKKRNVRPIPVRESRSPRNGRNVLVLEQTKWAGTGKAIVSQTHKALDQVLRGWV